MKKVFSLLMVAGMFTFFACGNAQKQQDAEKAQQDSITQADSIKRIEDEAKQIQMQDSLANAIKEDSIKKAEESKGKKK